jgi:hypothetical protein
MIIEVWDDYIASLKSLIGKETTYATYHKNTTARYHFQSFLIKNYRSDDVSLKAVDHYMITQFARHPA